MNKQQTTWIPLYRVQKFLTNTNNIGRKVNTNFTQRVHRKRLRPIEPQYEFEDLKRIDPSGYEAEPTIPEEQREPQLNDNQVNMHINQNDNVLPRTIPEQLSLTRMSKQQTSDTKMLPQLLNI